MAEAEWKPRIRKIGGSDREQMLYARSLFRDGRLDEAREVLERVLADNGESAPAAIALGRIHQAQKRHKDALDYFDVAIELDPSQARPYVLAGRSYLALGDVDRAGAAFRDALSVDAKLPDAQLGLAQVMLREDDFDGALAHANAALKLDPQLAPARFVMARLRGKAGDVDGAVDELETVLQTKPGHPGASTALATLYSRQDKHTKAAQLLESTTRAKPDDRNAWNMLGRVRMRMNDAPAAEKAYREALRLQPKSKSAKLRLIDALIAQGKFEQARESLESIPRRGRMQSMVHRYYGELYLAQNMHEEAARAYRAALLHGPDGEQRLAAVEADSFTVEGDAPLGAEGNWEALVERYRAALDEVREAARERRAERGGGGRRWRMRGQSGFQRGAGRRRAPTAG